MNINKGYEKQRSLDLANYLHGLGLLEKENSM